MKRLQNLLWLAQLVLLVLGAAPSFAENTNVRGLPYIRTYPLDEIGSVPRGLRLGVDAFGRTAVMYDGVYSVLNDTAWVSRIDNSSGEQVQMTTIRAVGGRYYYGGRGSWGAVEITPAGLFRAEPFSRKDAPAWTSVTAFNNVLGTQRGVYFFELNGAVYWDCVDRRNQYFMLPRVSTAFLIGERFFVSCQDGSLRELRPDLGADVVLRVPGVGEDVVEYAAALDGKRTLLAMKSGRLLTFDGASAAPWSSSAQQLLKGKITGMERLVEGGVAVALEGRGLYLFSPDGALRWALELQEFRRINSLIAAEAGVLWALGENAVHRVFYDSPLTGFGQQLGISVVWPNLIRWRDRVLVCSRHTLYRLEPPQPGYPAVFRPLVPPETCEVDQLVASENHLLVGNARGVFTISEDGRATQVAAIANVGALAFLSPDTCVAMGSHETAAIRFTEGRWEECAPRTEGVGDAPVYAQKLNSLWVEMGGDRVARVHLENGLLRLERLRLPWSGPQWTNIGVVGGTVVLTGAPGQRAYFDEATEQFRADPALDALLSRSPYWLLRMVQDKSGIIWATHARGVVTFTPRNGDYDIDGDTFELRNDSYPRVLISSDDDTWIAAGRSVYHVEREAAQLYRRPRPVMVSVYADQQHREFLSEAGALAAPASFPFEENSLTFRLFSGTYAWRAHPLFEYRLGPSESWMPVDPDMVLRFPKLRDGAYRFEVRAVRARAGEPADLSFPFAVRPPWYRTRLSYAAYGLGLLCVIWALARWVNHRSLQQNALLEGAVRERTKTLESTMKKLAEETRNAATLAERTRLAGEIHDSLQQGLSGAILHLDTTMTHPAVGADVHARLSIVRSMLSYSREEVQQAVWNLSSPLLQDGSLGAALAKLVGYINPTGGTINVQVQDEPPGLSAESRHHLLRLAQEAITNAVKHARARRIEVTLRSVPGAVELTVRDDGIGFDPGAAALELSHFGLRGMRARARDIPARLDIESSPGAGTLVRVTVGASPSPSS